jgi:hypothetical protein
MQNGNLFFGLWASAICSFVNDGDLLVPRFDHNLDERSLANETKKEMPT